MTDVDTITLEQHENYQKRSYRNRFYLNSAQGKVFFSIPLTKGKNDKQNIRDVRISYEDDWILLLSKVIKTNYGSAPYFEFYYDDFMAITNEQHDTLFELNHAWLTWIFNKIGLEVDIILSSQYAPSSDALNGDFRNKFRPHLPNPTSKKQVVYAQLYEERNTFINDLSIIDMIFCCGPETLSIIKNT